METRMRTHYKKVVLQPFSPQYRISPHIWHQMPKTYFALTYFTLSLSVLKLNTVVSERL